MLTSYKWWLVTYSKQTCHFLMFAWPIFHTKSHHLLSSNYFYIDLFSGKVFFLDNANNHGSFGECVICMYCSISVKTNTRKPSPRRSWMHLFCFCVCGRQKPKDPKLSPMTDGAITGAVQDVWYLWCISVVKTREQKIEAAIILLIELHFPGDFSLNIEVVDQMRPLIRPRKNMLCCPQWTGLNFIEIVEKSIKMFCFYGAFL